MIVLTIFGLVCLLELCSATDKIYSPNREVVPHSYPWVGWIRIGNKRVKCGATLIGTKTAATAASCVENVQIDAIIFGDHDRSSTDGNEQEFLAESTSIFPFYNSTSFSFDIATITLDREVDINEYVQPIDILPSNASPDRVLDKRCRVLGWGYEVAGDSSRVADQSNVLNEIVVKRNDTCAADASQTCFSPFRNAESVTCEGDVGGGYFCKSRRTWYLCGIISGWNVGEGCQAGQRAFNRFFSA